LHLEQRWQALEGKSAKSGVSRLVHVAAHREAGLVYLGRKKAIPLEMAPCTGNVTFHSHLQAKTCANSGCRNITHTRTWLCRRGGIRRRQLDLSGKPVHSLRASRLRRSRMQTGATRKPVFVLHKTAKQGAEAGVVVVPGEVADAEYLTQVTARVHVSDSNMSAR